MYCRISLSSLIPHRTARHAQHFPFPVSHSPSSLASLVEVLFLRLAAHRAGLLCKSAPIFRLD